MILLGRLQRWLHRSPNRRILGAAATIGILTVVAKVASLGKDTAIAYTFGTTDAMDAFLIGLVLPTYAINVVASSLNAAFISVLIEHREREGTAAAAQLFESIACLSLVLLAAATVLLAVAGPLVMPLLAKGFAPAKYAQTEHLFFLLLPVVLLSGMTTVYTGVLNAGERFALGALAPAAVPLVTLAVVLAFGRSLGVEALAWGTVIGYLANAIIVARAASKAGFSPMPSWRGWTPELRRVAGQYVPVMAGASLMSSTLLVDQAMASLLAPGSVAALNYGNKTISIATSLGTTALGTAVLPHFSRMVAQNDWKGLRHSVKTWSRLVLAVSVPVTLLLLLGSTTIVRSVFEWGAFTGRDTKTVSFVQAMYLLQLPFYALGILFVRTLTSIQRNHVLLWGNMISFPLNIALDLIFMKWIGAAGIALSTSVVYAVSCCYLGLMLRRSLADAAGAPISLRPALAAVDQR
jgi:putative peptidoglycan lipid II flippase